MSDTKATVFDIKRFAVHDGDGIRTTVFFAGCPLRCVWCHNPEGLAPRAKLAFYADKCTGCRACESACQKGTHVFDGESHTFLRENCVACGKCAATCPADALRLYGRRVTTGELLVKLLEDTDFYEESGGGVTLSGGECLLQADFCAELLWKLKAQGVNTAVDTCGAVPWTAFEKVIPYTDTFLYDVKAANDTTHRACTGASNTLILENLRKLDARGCRIEVRVPYVPGFNDGEIPGIAEILAPLSRVVRVRVLAYHNYAGSKYRALGLADTLPPDLPSQADVDAAQTLIDAARA